MTRQEYISEKALQSANDAEYFAFRNIYVNGYMAGIKEYLKDAWHTADEVPEPCRELLTKRTKGRSIQMDNVPPFLTDEEQKDYCRTHNIERWAYVDDLIG